MLCRISPSNGDGSPRVAGFYEEKTGSIQYVVIDEASNKAALIDIVQDFDTTNASTATDTAQEILRFAQDEGLTVEWVLDTHPHADHFMASAWLKEQTGAPNGIGEQVKEIAKIWRRIYGMPDAFDPEADFDRLFEDGETFRIGELDARVMLSPGHTPGSVTYVVGDAAFVHDTFMHVDFGTARCDFPGGSAKEMYRTLRRILDLPDDTRLFVGHDYGTEDRSAPAWEATVKKHREENAHIGGSVSEADFVHLRTERDKTLDLPDQMLYALQVNLRAGQVPDRFTIPANTIENWREI